MTYVLYIAACIIAIAITKQDVGNGGRYTFPIVAGKLLFSCADVNGWLDWLKQEAQ